MDLKEKTVDQITKILHSGAEVIFDGSGKTPEELLKIANAAATYKVTVTMMNVGNKTPDQLIKIGLAGKKFVVLGISAR